MAKKHKIGRVFDRLEPLVLCPCSGWNNLGSSVYEHTNGTRIHVGGGCVRTPNGKHYWLNSVVGGMGWTLIKINGGNKKRGMMAWAMNCIPQNDQDQVERNNKETER